MRRLLLIAASLTPLLFAASTEALAQRQFGGHGVRGGGFHGGGVAWRGGGGWRGGPAWGGAGWRGGPGWHGGGVAWRGGSGWRGGTVWRGGPGWRGSYWPRYRSRGWDSGWGWGAAGFATGMMVGAIAAQPIYQPVQPIYIDSGAGWSCSTPVRVCTLYNPAPVGIGCSCRVSGGRARGVVVP